MKGFVFLVYVWLLHPDMQDVLCFLKLFLAQVFHEQLRLFASKITIHYVAKDVNRCSQQAFLLREVADLEDILGWLMHFTM